MTGGIDTKVVVITGAGRGLGLGIARALSARGARLALFDRSAERIRDLAATFPGETIGCRCDVAAIDDVMAAQAEVLARFGRIDAWINNAGLALTGRSFADLPPGDFSAMVDSNLIGTFNGCKAALAAMRDRGGAIYNVFGAGSDGKPVPGMIGYGTTKRAVQFFTAQLAQEMAGSGTIVAGISPGLVITEGFLREHARVAPEVRAQREAVVNLIGDTVETVAEWAADIVVRNRRNGRVFRWLTPAKINQRRGEPGRNILDAQQAEAA